MKRRITISTEYDQDQDTKWVALPLKDLAHTRHTNDEPGNSLESLIVRLRGGRHFAHELLDAEFKRRPIERQIVTPSTQRPKFLMPLIVQWSLLDLFVLMLVFLISSIFTATSDFFCENVGLHFCSRRARSVRFLEV